MLEHDSITLDGFIFSYEIESPGDKCSRQGHIDDWYPDAPVEWTLVGIDDAETNTAVTANDVAAAWTLDDEDEVWAKIVEVINRKVDG